MSVQPSPIDRPCADQLAALRAQLAQAQSQRGPALAFGLAALDDRLAFSPWNALAAHRPLGGINRARREVMAVSRRLRSTFNGCPLHGPGTAADDTTRAAD